MEGFAMSAKSLSPSSQLAKLKAENRQLKAENKRLQQTSSVGRTNKSKFGRNFWRSLGAIFLISLAVALAVTGNLLFWSGNTLVKNNRFTTTVSPIIKNPTVDKALADYTTNQLFNNVDVTQVVTNALPPRAEFLAPTISDQLKGKTNETLQKILSNPKFQTTWNNTLSKAHARFIETAKKHGADGSIDINELYQQISQNLQGTKLAFLANKPLPSKIGNIQVASGSWLSNLQRIINHIDAWRIMAIILFLICVIGGVFLSLKRRRTVISFGIIAAISMLVTLISLRIVREFVAGRVNPAYSQAVRETIQIIFHPLVLQTTALLLVFTLVAFIAWISGQGKAANTVKARTSDLFAGKLHSALFGKRESGFTKWLGKYKAVLEWLLVAITAIILLLVRPTPATLLVYSLVLLVLILVVEVLAAPAKAGTKRRKA